MFSPQGQRQRISLARAVYQRGQIYLLDDPISAVDPSLRRSLFNDVISNKGLLRDTTRITIISESSLVENMDRVILMEEKTILDIDTLDELKRKHDLDLEVFSKECEDGDMVRNRSNPHVGSRL